jgi:alpha-L-arabinofuranosidase
MIWYDNLRSVKSANYYVQQLYSKYLGTNVQKVTANNENVTGQNGIYASVVTDENQKKLIIKISNVNKTEKEISFNLKLKDLPEMLSGKQITLKAGLEDENTLDDPYLVKPLETVVSFNSKTMKILLNPESFNVFVLDLSAKQ